MKGRPARFDESFLRKLEALTVVAKRARGGDLRAERRSRRVGAGIEFADHREYAPGDDVRSLDWSLFARLGRPYIRLREEDEDATLSIVVDTSASMGCGSPPKLELALRIAAALGYVALASLDRVGVSLVNAELRDSLSPVRGKAAAPRMLSFLEGANAAGSTDLAAALGRAWPPARGAGPGRRGLTILISDMLDRVGCVPALDRLRSARQDTVLVLLTAGRSGRGDDGDGDGDGHGDGGDLAPEEGVFGEVELEDAETGQLRRLTVSSAVRRAHAERYQALLRGVLDPCRRRGVPCVQIPADVPFEDAVLRILRAGGVLR